MRTGTFEETAQSVSGKYFAETIPNAIEWGNRMMGQGNYRIIQVEFPDVVADGFIRWQRLDGIGPARFATMDQLSKPLSVDEVRR
jgi:hypothetical protein